MDDRPEQQSLKPPTTQLQTAADALDSVIGDFLDCRPPPNFEWEADVEAYVMSNLVVRHVEATAQLARCDMVLLPAAWATARSALEVSARAEWLLEPDDPYEREARWLARLREGARFYGSVADRLDQLGGSADSIRAMGGSIDDFATDVSNRMPNNVNAVPGIPSADALIGTVPDRYLTYKMGSQYVHGTHEGASIYRRSLGTEKRLQERVGEPAWKDPLIACLNAMEMGLSRYLEVSGADASGYLSSTRFSRARRIVGRLGR